MDAKNRVLRAAILTMVVLVWGLSMSPIGSALAAGDGNKKICSFLGDDPKPSILDQDIFEFNGTKGEKVTVTLMEDSSGSHTGKQANLSLMDWVTRTWFLRTTTGALPRTITAVLPATGKYFILVAELPGLAKLESFRGAYCLTLVSSAGASATLTRTPWVENRTPIANAGPDQTVFVTQTVTLDGSKSSDLDGDPLAYKWSFKSVPSGSAATLSALSAVNPTFVVDKPGTYVAQLIVNDGKVDSPPDTVTIQTISNIKVTPSSLGLGEPGSNAQLKVTGKLPDGTEVDITSSSFGTVYSSQNTGIATATNGGLVSAVALGRTTVTVTNTSFLANVPVAVRGTPPAVSNILFPRTFLPVPREYEQFILSVMFAFSDPNRDVQSYNFTLTGPNGGIILSSSTALSSDQPTGTGSRKFVVDSTFGEGAYQIGIEILDAMGNSSGVTVEPFTIDPTAPRFLEITGVEPSSGRPGDTVVITGIGFETDPLANNVSFEKALGRTQVLSATGTQLQVVVPDGATTGTVGLMTSQGRTDSPAPFTIVPTISLSPASTQVVTGGSTDFSCNVSGTATYNITWSVSGPGTIDNRGRFTAPSSLPPVNPITLRCTSADDPAVYAEASITVVAPAPMPGQNLIQAATGGQMTSARGEATIIIPPGSMASDTVISVQAVDPGVLPTPAGNFYNLAAVQLEPTGLQFSQPVTVVFSLRNQVAPGTVLPVYLLDNGVLTNAGKTATVDQTGLKATGTVDHFSMFVVPWALTPVEVAVQKYFVANINTIATYFPSFGISLPAGLSFLEGLSVPIEVNRAGGAPPPVWNGEGYIGMMGPFLPKGISIKASIPSTNTQLGIGPIVQPSGDGWELGTVITIPTLPNCNEGQTLAANLIISYGNLGLSQTMTIPFTVECLNELNISSDMNISSGSTYRFSEMNINPGGRLIVNYTEGSDPAVIQVTGNVNILGEINSTGGKGSPGSDGVDYWSGLDHKVFGGSGGGGSPYGGGGGDGGPFSGEICWGTTDCQAQVDQTYPGLGLVAYGYTDCSEYPNSACGCNKDTQYTAYCSCWPRCTLSQSNNGQDGANSPNGGIGGQGGQLWEAGSFLAFLYNAYSFVLDLGAIIASPGTAVFAYKNAVVDGYGAIEEQMKLWNDNQSQMASLGWGGTGPSQDYASNLSSFRIPLGGGGGGGAGKMQIEMEPDRAGGGGGGGGGGAPSLKLVTPGSVYIGPGGSINGKGGNGGHGGDGSGGWGEQAAPGGGGGGGNGAQVLIIAREVLNNGTISLKGGLGGASGRVVGLFYDYGPYDIPGVRDCPWNSTCPEGFHCYWWEPEPGCQVDPTKFYLVQNGFGQSGRNGVLRVDGDFAGSSLQDTNFYRGLLLGPTVQVSSGSAFCEQYFLNDKENSYCSSLSYGLNTIAVSNNVDPWQRQYVFNYSLSWKDTDNDGLWDGLEWILGTNPNLKDTDGDGYTDAYEFAQGSDPLNPNSTPVYNLVVAKQGDGSGVVTSSPAGINCGSTCQAIFTTGSQVTLQAVPSFGSYFGGWSGGGCSGTGSCTVTVPVGTFITAHFLNYHPLEVIAGGFAHTLALKSGGTLWAWGYNNYGQVGDGTDCGMCSCSSETCADKHSPEQIGSDNHWVSIAAGQFHSLALKSDGTLWAWGLNASGQVGDGTTLFDKKSPVQIGSDNHWVSIAGGQEHSLALKSDGTLGTLWAWGRNSYGQLGDDTIADKHSPVQIGSDNHWVSIAAGQFHSLALKSDGTLWAWGHNSYGQLGDDTIADKHSPVQIGSDNHWVSIAAGQFHSLALKSDDTLWAWGYNTHGELGDNSTTDKHSPVQIGSDNNWVSIAAGVFHTLALKSDGTLWAWGYNTHGELGDDINPINPHSPVQIGTDNNWVSIAAGYDFSIALKSDGTLSLWAWGDNTYGQLGDGTTKDSHIPESIMNTEN